MNRPTSHLDIPVAAAPRRQRIWQHGWMEARLVARNGEQLLLALVIPGGLLIGQRIAGARFGLDPQTFPAAVLGLGLWSTGFTSLAIQTAFERRYGVLERLVATPLRKVDLILGKAVAVGLIALGQAGLVGLVAFSLGWAPQSDWLSTALLVPGVVLALLGFAGLAMAFAGSASAELTLAGANLVYLLGAITGLLIPVSAFPGWAQPLIDLLPTAALGELLRGWAIGEAEFSPLLVLLGWACGALLLARKVFQWTS